LQELKVSVPKIQQNYEITTINTWIQGEPGSIALELLVVKSTIHTWHDPLCMQRSRPEIQT